ncbi:MAG: hypothetical protein FD156_550 [Nitrospirae bacterium]|nr:MAG: hypothetical protein FD156_550 [Nitrospirota bacterium]
MSGLVRFSGYGNFISQKSLFLLHLFCRLITVLSIKEANTMRIYLLCFVLCFSLCIICPNSDATAGNQLIEEQALNILQLRIQKDKLYNSWTTMSCLSFIIEEKNKDYFDFAIREKHGGRCPGDPNTAPVVDRFRVNRTTKQIQWYEPTEGELLPYKAVLKSRLKK